MTGWVFLARFLADYVSDNEPLISYKQKAAQARLWNQISIVGKRQMDYFLA